MATVSQTTSKPHGLGREAKVLYYCSNEPFRPSCEPFRPKTKLHPGNMEKGDEDKKRCEMFCREAMTKRRLKLSKRGEEIKLMLPKEELKEMLYSILEFGKIGETTESHPLLTLAKKSIAEMYGKTPDWTSRNLTSIKNILDATKELPARQELAIPVLNLLLKESQVVKLLGDRGLLNRIADLVEVMVDNQFIVSLIPFPVLLYLLEELHTPSSPGHHAWETYILGRLEEENPYLFQPPLEEGKEEK